MRMWNIPPQMLCTKHLLGEHVEMHMFVGTINKKKSIKEYLDNELVDTSHIRKRHYELVSEMKRREFNHQSPLPKFEIKKSGSIDIKKNIKELARRCKECKKKINPSFFDSARF
ncbi:MAG: pyrimidine dimer DNA glycosylase/endonuclease V [archaeon]|nr:pyrimidine dimer DNA glycosylase/endonuclease V [archaeon]